MELSVSSTWTLSHFDPEPEAVAVPPSSPETSGSCSAVWQVFGAPNAHGFPPAPPAPIPPAPIPPEPPALDDAPSPSSLPPPPASAAPYPPPPALSPYPPSPYPPSPAPPASSPRGKVAPVAQAPSNAVRPRAKIGAR